MGSYEERMSLMSDMVEFAKVDGKVHEREFQFLSMVASQLKIEKDSFDNLFVVEAPNVVVKSEHQRILQFYRLALIMHADGILHNNEQKAIRELGINMGLSPYAMKGVLREIEHSPNGMVDPEVLLALFRAQHN